MEYPICAPKSQWPRCAEYAGASAGVGRADEPADRGDWACKGTCVSRAHPARNAHSAILASRRRKSNPIIFDMRILVVPPGSKWQVCCTQLAAEKQESGIS